MKKINCLTVSTILFSYLLFPSLSFQNNERNYFPLSVGNKFFYSTYSASIGGGGYGRSIISVTKDTIFGEQKYYYIQGGIYSSWFRVDSISGSLYMYDAANSCSTYYYSRIRDILRAELNQVTSYCTVGLANTCTSITNNILFGDSVVIKNFYVAQSNQTHNRKYSDKFGPIYTENLTTGMFWHYDESEIIGCFINGVFYGDSVVVGVNNNQESVPDTYKLHQNYPNPFNPATRIKYDIILSGVVSIKVYDILGNEVDVLINEPKQAGSHEVDFDDRDLPSGVYYYKLVTGNFSETRKMILLK